MNFTKLNKKLKYEYDDRKWKLEMLQQGEKEEITDNREKMESGV